jgi:hypothetical protein
MCCDPLGLCRGGLASSSRGYRFKFWLPDTVLRRNPLLSHHSEVSTLRWFFNKLPAWVKLLILGISASASAYLAIASLYEWKHQERYEVLAIISVAAISVAGTVRSVIQDKLRSEWKKKRESLAEAMDGALLSAADECLDHMKGRMIDNVRSFNIGLFVIQGRKWWWGDRRVLIPELRRGLGIHQPSNVKWTYGKGVVGQVWETRREKFLDLNPIIERHGGAAREEWSTVRDATRMGLSFDDWQATRGKYGTIVGVPVFDNSDKLVGVLALDVAVGHYLKPVETRLTQVLQACARTIALISS